MKNKLRILYLSWRDIDNPKRGGAEIYVWETVTRLQRQGFSVTIFAATFPGAAAEEVKDGISIIRRGNFFSVHGEAIKFVRARESEFDLVIDELHGYPFFTNFYVNLPRLTVIHEVAGQIWLKMWPLPIGLLGMAFEKIFYRMLRDQQFIAISASTRDDLVAQGISSEQISVVPVGNSVQPLPPAKLLPKRSKQRQICFVGRVCKMKGVDQLLITFAQVLKREPDLKLVLIGKLDEQFLPRLEALIAEHKLEGKVELTGFISDAERNGIIAESMYLVSCSVKEGWGMVVTEAGALGTPSITFDVNGYREAIKHGETGYLVNPATAAALAEEIVNRLGASESEYAQLQLAAYDYSQEFSWDNSAAKFAQVITELQSSRPQSPSRLRRIFVKALFTCTNLFGKVAQGLRLI